MRWTIRGLLIAGLVSASVFLWGVLAVGMGGQCVAPICGPLQIVRIVA